MILFEKSFSILSDSPEGTFEKTFITLEKLFLVNIIS
jgi:hypothetical protein